MPTDTFPPFPQVSPWPPFFPFMFVFVLILSGQAIVICLVVASVVHRIRHRKRQQARKQAILLDETKGYPLWLSFSRGRADLHHTVLYVNGYKYELRLLDEERGIPMANLEKTEIPTWPGRPESEGPWVFFHVGWTRREHDEIERIAQELITPWVYDLMLANCQHFLHVLLDEIMDEGDRNGMKKMYGHLSEWARKVGRDRDREEFLMAIGLSRYRYRDDEQGRDEGTSV